MVDFLQSISWITVVLLLFGVYALWTVVFIIMENRSPHSTFAWIFALLVLPVLGVVIYLFFGREVKAFSQRKDLTMQELGGDLTPLLQPLVEREKEVMERIKEEKSESYSYRLLELVRHNSNSMLTGRNALEILQNAEEKYPRLMADIAAASSSIHMEYFSWDEDKFTQKLKKLLLEKAAAGVEVRLLIDAMSFNKLSRRYVEEMREGGIEIEGYLDYLSPLRIHNISYRNHRKIVVIDGRIGYTGGLNIGQQHLDGGKHFSGWRDTHLRLEGEAVHVLQSIFVTSWFNSDKERLAGRRYFPEVEEAERFLPLQITTAGPDSRWAGIRQLYFAMILAAREHIHIQSPFFIPEESLREALKAAALSGVNIKLMCAPRGTSYSVPYWAANTYFKEMAEAGIEIYLYQNKYFHPKTISIDGKICSIGTANFDIRSFSLDYEVNAVIYDRDVTAELDEDFEHDLTHCERFTLEAYKKRSPLVHFRDSVARLASPLL